MGAIPVVALLCCDPVSWLLQAGCASSTGCLPAGIQLGDLVVDHVEAIPATSDSGNPDMESEFFDTRQVNHPALLCPGP